MMTNEMHHTTTAIIMILSLSLSIILGAVIFLSSIENTNVVLFILSFKIIIAIYH